MIGIAKGYAADSLAVIPILPRSKAPACRWRDWQWEPPTESEIEVLFDRHQVGNLAVLCGAASKNLAVLDMEEKGLFSYFLNAFEKRGIHTWAVESSRGGHIYVRTPVPVRPWKAQDGTFELRAQGQYVLAPPSIHPSGVAYRFLNRPREIATLPSFDALEWLGIPLQPIPPPSARDSIPRRTFYLLSGKGSDQYPSRSDLEQAIIVGLVNALFTFDRVLALFLKCPAAGKFREMNCASPQNAIRWLRLSFERARLFCAQESPERKRAQKLMAWASNTPWPGRTGSTDRAIFIAHTSIAYRSGRAIYSASCRELAEIAGCQKVTASRSNRRLIRAELIEYAQPSTAMSAQRFRLLGPHPKSDHNRYTPTQPPCEGVYQSSSFSVPDTFRQRGLGRSALEIWTALQAEPMTVKELAVRTGRHPQTVRRGLKRMREIIDRDSGEVFSLVEKKGKQWHATTGVDLDEVAETIGTKGARRRQQAHHNLERFRRQTALAVSQHEREAKTSQKTNPGEAKV